MNLTSNPFTSFSRRAFTAAILAVTLLATSVAHAQDFEAVERRLAEAVVDGELTLRQANAMMEALRDTATQVHKHEKKAEHKENTGHEEKSIAGQFEQWIESVGGDLKAAVQAGKLSEEDAWKKWRHFKEHQLAPKLEASVAHGHLDETTAMAIWQGVEKAELAQRLKAAVERGELSEEEAKAKWKEIEQSKAERDHHKKEGKHEDPRVVQYRAFEAKVHAAVKAGKLSRQEAEKELIAAKKKLFGGK